MNKNNIRTTLTIPEDILKATDEMVSKGKVKSRNEFITIALQNELKAIKRAEINEQLKEMAMGEEYHLEVLKMEAEFSSSSWEALQLGDEVK